MMMEPEESAAANQSKPELPFNKVLELLLPKVEAGRPLPESLTTPPWRLPNSATEKSVQINQILSKSMEIQSSKIPKSDDFDAFILSNSCLAVSGLIKYYLQSLDLVQEAKVVFGVMLWDANARDGPDDFEGNVMMIKQLVD